MIVPMQRGMKGGGVWTYVRGNNSEMNKLWIVIAERVLGSLRSPDGLYRIDRKSPTSTAFVSPEARLTHDPTSYSCGQLRGQSTLTRS